MNLLGNTTSKACVPQRSIKQILLNEQIVRLKDIYRRSSQALQKIIVILKKIMNNKSSQGQENGSSNTYSNVLDDLSYMQDAFISLVQNMESDRQLFTSSVMFRDSQKLLDSIFFKKMMKNHEDFKQKLNTIILRLQKDIQLLQVNGFHIYDFNVKPNNVLNSLKKIALQKYLLSLAQIQVIYDKIIKVMSNQTKFDKKYIKTQFKSEIERYKQGYKNVTQINLKQKLVNSMLIEQIYKIKTKIQNQKQKIKSIEESIKISNKLVNFIETQIKIYNDEQVTKRQMYNLGRHFKEKIDSLIIVTPQLYNRTKNRSKSCCTVIITQPSRYISEKINQHSLIQTQSSKILPCDFLQESMQS